MAMADFKRSLHHSKNRLLGLQRLGGRKKKKSIPNNVEKDETVQPGDKEVGRQRDWIPASLHYPLASLSGRTRAAGLDGLSRSPIKACLMNSPLIPSLRYRVEARC